jgi:hypothetical protein
MNNQIPAHIAQQQAELLAQIQPPTAQQIAEHYNAMLSSVSVINAVIAGQQMQYNTTQQKKECVDRNVRHLETMRRQDFWTTEDMTTVNAAIADGTAYIANA